MQHNIFADDFAERTFLQECGCKLIQFIERHIGCVRPVERELIATVWIVGEIACVDTVRNNKQLDVIKQTVIRSFVIALNLVVCNP